MPSEACKVSRRWPHEERREGRSGQLEELVQKRTLDKHEAHMWLLVTECSPTPGRGAAKVEEARPGPTKCWREEGSKINE